MEKLGESNNSKKGHGSKIEKNEVKKDAKNKGKKEEKNEEKYKEKKGEKIGGEKGDKKEEKKEEKKEDKKEEKYKVKNKDIRKENNKENIKKDKEYNKEKNIENKENKTEKSKEVKDYKNFKENIDEKIFNKEKGGLPKGSINNLFSSNRTNIGNDSQEIEFKNHISGKNIEEQKKHNSKIKDENNKKEKEESQKDGEKKKEKKNEEKKEKVKLKFEYENKKEEINKLDENIRKKEENINIKISKNESKTNKLKKEKEDFKKEKELFDIYFKQRENELKEREKKLAQKEERLKRMIEFNVPPNSPPILIGLNNIGATCYMNASLQCFSNTKKLSEYFLYDYKEDKNKKLSNEFYHVLRNLWKKENNNKSYSPTSFKEVLSKENPLFKGVAANDSKDLINFLLERFHQELGGKKINKKNKGNNKKNSIEENMGNIDQTNESQMLKFFFDDFQEKYNTPISNCFYGILETKTQCNLCKLIKFNFQIYSFLEFPLQQVNQYLASQGKKPLLTNDGKNPDIDLYECFEYNGKIDSMTGENQMYCNKCNKLNDSLFSTSIYSGPNYLIIILNRGKGAIYECKVNFPEQLNLLNYITIKTIAVVYELYAVISHLGPSSMDGHFVAYCRNRMDNKWYLYNDAIVSLCSRPQQYNDGMPYILFYKAI